MEIPTKFGDLTISTVPVKMLFDGLVRMGLKRSVLEKKTGINSAKLILHDKNLPMVKFQKLLEAAIDFTGNEDFALEWAASLTPEYLGLVGHIMRNCSTIAEAGEILVRYWRLLSDAFIFQIIYDSDKNLHFISIPVAADYFFSWTTSCTLAATIAIIRQLTAKDLTPVEVCFQISEPANTKKLKKIFRAPLSFCQPDNIIILSLEQHQLKISSGHDYLEQILKSHANELLKKMDQKATFAHQVQKIILQSMPKGELNVEYISEKLNMSRWTLTRQLTKEGTSFYKLYQQARKNLAKNYLLFSEYSIGEVAFFLGYSEPSAFHRAFKNWIGITPAEYRKKKTSKSPG